MNESALILTKSAFENRQKAGLV